MSASHHSICCPASSTLLHCRLRRHGARILLLEAADVTPPMGSSASYRSKLLSTSWQPLALIRCRNWARERMPAIDILFLDVAEARVFPRS